MCRSWRHPYTLCLTRNPVLKPMQIRLRTRLVLGTVITLLPLMAVSIGVFVYANFFTRHFDEAVSEVTTELAPVHKIQKSLAGVVMGVHDFLIAPGPGETENYDKHIMDIDGFFLDGRNRNAFKSPEEIRLFLESEAEWRRTKEIAEAIFRGSQDQTQALKYRKMKQFDEQTKEFSRQLDQIQIIASKELQEARREAFDFRNKLFYNMGALLILGILIGALSAIHLSRSILQPVRELIQGTRRLASKELDYRIPVGTSDEFGELSTAFNAMAERLDRTYKVLHEMATRDDLTLLLNAREFHRRLEIEMSRADRYRHPLSLIFLDVDHFKSVNDTFGHQVGDEVLRAVARILGHRVRPTDHVARYGGEEFAVICPETGLQDANIVAERIRVAFHDSVVYHAPTGPLSISVSLGVSCFPESSENEHNLLKDADQALYQAKNDGRNCTRIFSSRKSD